MIRESDFGSASRPPHGTSRPPLRAALSAVLVYGSLAAALVGCGQVTSVGARPPRDCGTITARAANLQPADPSSIENCFYSGFTTCEAVSLTYTQMGVDAGATRTFTTQTRGNGCGITDKIHTYVVPTKGDHTETYDCAGVVRRDGGLLFSACGRDGDVLVPGSASAGAS